MNKKMDSTEKLDQIVGRAIRDPEYRKKLAEDPKGTLEKEGLSEHDLEDVAGGALGSSNVGATSIYNNLRTTFGGTAINPGQVAWSSDLTCNERG